MIIILCSICGNKCTHTEHFDRVAHKLADAYDADLKFCDVDIYRCDSCSHFQITPCIDDDYYNEYEMGYFWGSSFTRLRQAQVERLADLAPDCKRFLDIGCGTGQYLVLAQPYFERLYGIEPSVIGASLAQNRGFDVINDYFHDGLTFESGFDAISIIEVLEHLEHPLTVFVHAVNCLNENGIILVEVPNGQRIFEKHLYSNIITDHIQYFSVQSLVQMAKIAGVAVICVQESVNPNLLELYARKSMPAVDSFHIKRQQDVDRIVSRIPDGALVAAWGAGAESLCYLDMLDKKIQIHCLFDSNKAKHGRCIAHIPIIQPTSESVCAFDIIILFAHAHEQQIQEQLLDLGFQGNLLMF